MGAKAVVGANKIMDIFTRLADSTIRHVTAVGHRLLQVSLITTVSTLLFHGKVANWQFSAQWDPEL